MTGASSSARRWRMYRAFVASLHATALGIAIEAEDVLTVAAEHLRSVYPYL